MRLIEVHDGPRRHHSGRVDGGVAFVIVVLGVVEVAGVGDPGVLV